MAQVLGEFGRNGGQDVVTVIAVKGHVAEVKRLWKQLDEADAIEQDEIFRRLESLGAIRRD